MTVLSCRELSPGSLVFTLPLPVICWLGDSVPVICSSNHRFLSSLMIQCSELMESVEIKWLDIGKELGIWYEPTSPFRNNTVRKLEGWDLEKDRFGKRKVKWGVGVARTCFWGDSMQLMRYCRFLGHWRERSPSRYSPALITFTLKQCSRHLYIYRMCPHSKPVKEVLLPFRDGKEK